MGYAVDVEAMTTLAQRLSLVGEDLAAAAQATARAWQLAASAVADGELRAVATDSARAWGSGVELTSQLTTDLARATGEAAARYREVEAAVARSWTVQPELLGRHVGWLS